MIGCGGTSTPNTACSVSPVFAFPVAAGDDTFVLEVAKQGPNGVLAFVVTLAFSVPLLLAKNREINRQNAALEKSNNDLIEAYFLFFLAFF